jgi:peptidoglycan/xylan/chitin deacetylase (PgdA/CDA1 family)
LKFLFRPTYLHRSIFKHALWRICTEEKSIYLTFDDGPIPELTEWILDVLKEHNVKATFFCVGENIQKNPLIFQRILNEGHQVGNHTFNHLKGWRTSLDNYSANITQCQKFTKTNLFRPPYGRITLKQYKHLLSDYKIVFWDVLTHDYSSKITPEKCLKNVIKYSRRGSIVVFHDNLKAINTLKYVLPKYIEHFLKLNYKFVAIDSLPIS